MSRSWVQDSILAVINTASLDQFKVNRCVTRNQNGSFVQHRCLKVLYTLFSGGLLIPIITHISIIYVDLFRKKSVKRMLYLLFTLKFFNTMMLSFWSKRKSLN